MCWWSVVARPAPRQPSMPRVKASAPVLRPSVSAAVLDTTAIENFISVQETEGPKLATALEEHVKQYDVDIMNLQRGEALIPATAGGLHEVRPPAAPRSRPRP